MESTKEKYFVKNCPSPEAAQAEAYGLELLRTELKGSSIKIPKVLSLDGNILKLELIQAQPSVDDFNFGSLLASFHLQAYESCGLEEDNFIGISQQKNQLCKNWGEFFFLYRLLPQLQDLGWGEEINEFKFIVKFLNENIDHFSLLHGDLWSGNYLFDGESYFLIDPAVYYGDADADIAMTELFGGFSESFYQGYWSVRNKSKNYLLKKEIYNLYHILNHAQIFAGGYRTQAIEIMKKLKKENI